MFAVLLASALFASIPEDTLHQRRDRSSAPARRESPVRGVGFGFGLGPHFSLGEGPVGAKAGLRFSYELPELAPAFSIAITFPVTVSGSRQEGSLSTIERTGVELLPGARASFAVIPKLRLYADAGLGAAIYQFNVQFQGRQTGSAAGFAFRLGLGAEYALLEKLFVFVEPAQLLLQAVPSVVFRSGGETIVSESNMAPHWALLVGVQYRL